VVVHGLSQEHTISHILQDGLGTRHILETNAITDFLSKFDIHLLCDTLSDGHGSHTTRLGTGDHLALRLGEVIEQDELRDLGSLSGTGLTDEDQNLRLLVELKELITAREKKYR
jgi:hypothetical protein